jgi:hypothetical protein
MPDTSANVAIVTAAYNKWQRRLREFKEKDPGITKADVDSAYKAMQAAIREWEKPGPGETARAAKVDRKPKRKIKWPKFK